MADDLWGKLAQTWPARAAQGLWDGLTLPGDVYQGNVSMYGDDGHTNPQVINRAADLAGMVTGGSYAAAPAVENGVGMGIRGFHGSPRVDLTNISATPATRQFDNATSQLGAYFAPNPEGAQRYAGKTGKIYSAEVPVENPYEMPWGEFNALQSPHKGPNGETLPGDQWGVRADQLKQDAARLRDQLMAAGHDGVVVRKSNGDIYEMASFGDVPVR